MALGSGVTPGSTGVGGTIWNQSLQPHTRQPDLPGSLSVPYFNSLLGAVLLKELEATVSVFGQLGHLVQCFSPDEMLLLRPMLGAMSQLCLGAT